LFGTRNQFYGGQIGTKAEAQFGRYFASFLGDVALGADHQSVSINGIAAVTPPGMPTVTTPGGLFAQATNSGRQTRNPFTVVPEAHLRVGARLTDSIRVFVGYDVLYANNVVRPASQIDRVLNFTANPGVNGATMPLPLAGIARPEPEFNHTDFWAQGVTFGLELRF
jgi:hypothetical protein